MGKGFKGRLIQDLSAELKEGSNPQEWESPKEKWANDLLRKEGIRAGFERFGINFESKFIHTDLDKDKVSPTIWGY